MIDRTTMARVLLLLAVVAGIGWFTRPTSPALTLLCIGLLAAAWKLSPKVESLG